MITIHNVATRKFLLLLFLALPAIIFASCKLSEEATENPGNNTISSGSVIENIDETEDLSSQLTKIAGVRVDGIGAYARVHIRGINSFGSSSAPLFIIDEGVMTRNYSNVYHMVSGVKIKRIRVLKGAEAARYGMEGTNGVIEITTGNSQ